MEHVKCVLGGNGDCPGWACPKQASPLRAEHFLWLVAEEEVNTPGCLEESKHPCCELPVGHVARNRRQPVEVKSDPQQTTAGKGDLSPATTRK